MAMKPHRIYLILGGVSLVSLIGLLLLLPRMPEQIPIHWNSAGEIDSYGSRWMLLLFGALPLLMLGLFQALPRMDPRKENYQKHMGPYLLLTTLITVLMIVAGWITALSALGVSVPVNRILPAMIGVLFICLGNYMPRIRFNYTFGIRTPWTLASEAVWKKTHRAGGIGFVLCGAVLLLAAVLPWEWLPSLAAAALGMLVVFLFLYSWLLYRKEERS